MKIGIFGLLTIIFVLAKLANIITWSWFWVLSPLWGGFVLLMLLLIVMFGLAIVVEK